MREPKMHHHALAASSLTLLFLLIFQTITVQAGSVTKRNSTCSIGAGVNGEDDAPAILEAFELCKEDSTIFFEDATYHIESVMNTTGLRNVVVDLSGTLLVSPFT